MNSLSKTIEIKVTEFSTDAGYIQIMFSVYLDGEWLCTREQRLLAGTIKNAEEFLEEALSKDSVLDMMGLLTEEQ